MPYNLLKRICLLLLVFSFPVGLFAQQTKAAPVNQHLAPEPKVDRLNRNITLEVPGMPVVSPQEESEIALPDDFPVMQSTGNQETDQRNYAIAKDKWIKENPDRYAELTSSQARKE